MNDALDFSFTFDERDTADTLLHEARRTVLALPTNLGPGKAKAGKAGTKDSDARSAALRLLDDLETNVARFPDVLPELLPLGPDDFKSRDIAPPPQLAERLRAETFYWLRLPYTLQSKTNYRFERIQCAFEINPGAAALGRPSFHSALPKTELTTLAETTVDFNAGIDESLEFAVDAGVAKGGGKQAGKIAFVAGPFVYRIQKAIIERDKLPSDRLRWRITGAEALQDPPDLIAVIAVPKGTKDLRVACALRAESSGHILTMGLGDFINYLGAKLKSFFASGAPKPATQVWDLSSKLSG